MQKSLSAIITLFGVTTLGACAAQAETLRPAADAPAWMHLGAAALLYLHIGGGTAGIVSGVVASLSRKGGAAHRVSGWIFAVSMFITYVIGAGVAPFLLQGQRPNFVGGVLALYLLVTGVLAAKRRRFEAGRAEWVGLACALIITGLGLAFVVMGANSASGTVDGSPPEAFYVFIIAGVAATAGEINVIVKGSLSGMARLTRHMWRMCGSFFLATGSLFMGQPQVFPDWFNASPLPFLLSFAPLFVMLTWLVQVRFGRRAASAWSPATNARSIAAGRPSSRWRVPGVRRTGRSRC